MTDPTEPPPDARRPSPPARAARAKDPTELAALYERVATAMEHSAQLADAGAVHQEQIGNPDEARLERERASRARDGVRRALAARDRLNQLAERSDH